jgi:hypothetical protein
MARLLTIPRAPSAPRIAPADAPRRGGSLLERVGSWPFVLAAWASSRALFLVTGAIGAHALRQANAVGFPREPDGILNYWAHWDGGWFSSIATQGYGATLWPASANFFPVFPFLVNAGTLLGAGPALAGVVISLAASLLALWFLYELAADLLSPEAARAATLALAFFPTSFFLNAVYSEAIFLALAIGAVWAARVRGNFLLAAILGGLAADTRNVGIFLLLPLLHEALRRRHEAGWSALAPLLIVPAGLLSYMAWLWRWSSHPLLFMTVVHRTWGRTVADPVTTLRRAWTVAETGAVWAVHPGRVFATASPNPSFGAMETFNLVFLALLAVCVLAAFVRLPLGLALYGACAAAIPVLTPASFSPLASLPRYFLAVFPAFLVLGWLLAGRRLLLAGWLVASSALGVLLTLYFTTWRWVA